MGFHYIAKLSVFIKKCFFGGILLFPWYFEFSEGKVEVFYFFQGKMQNTSEFWLFPPVFHFSLSILTFLREKWRFFTFSKGKCKIPQNFDFSLRFSLFPPKYLQFYLQNTEEKVKNQRENSKYRGILHFPLEKVKKTPLFPQKSQNTEGKVKNRRGKVKNPRYFAFSLGKSEKNQGKSQNTKGKVKILREKQNTSEKALFPPKIPTRRIAS